jgi:hypothetical protein
MPESVPNPAAAIRVMSASPPLRLFAGLLLLVFGLVLTGACLLLSLGLTREYGSDGPPAGQAAAVGVVTAVALGSGLAMTGRWSLRVLVGAAAAGLVLGTAAPVLGVTIGARQHRDDLARAASACSSADRALLRGLPFESPRSSPVGSADGSCGVEVQVSGSRDDVRAALTTAGWRHTGDADGAAVYQRGGATVQVVTNGGEPEKGLTVRITIPRQP